jgi:fructose-1,6-bisphosphatase II
VDLAVDPLEGTRLLSDWVPGAMAVLAASPRGTMWSPGPAFYMEKLVAPAAAGDAIDITATPSENLARVAKALGGDVPDLRIFVLDKPRHRGLVAELREAGARVRLVPDGDVAGAILAALPEGDVDLLMGVGGTPEGVIAAAAVKALRGALQCRLAPQSEEEQARVVAAGMDPSRVLGTEDLVAGPQALFVATGITTGDLTPGVAAGGEGTTTWSLLLHAPTGEARLVRTTRRTEPAAGEGAP